MRAMFVGASMLMPTLELKYEDTIICRIKKAFPNIDFIDKTRRAYSTSRLLDEGQNSLGYDLLEFYAPNFVILYMGLTDASPRLLKRNAWYTKVINHLPCSKFIYHLVRKCKGRTISCADVSPEKFYKNLSIYANRASKEKCIIFCVKILHCGEKVVKKSPQMNESVDLYNTLFDKLAQCYSNVVVIEPSLGLKKSLEDYMQSDHIHLNPDGCRIISENIINAIKKNISFEQ